MPSNNRDRNVDRIQRGQLVFILERICVGGGRRTIYIYIYIGSGGETIAPVYSPTTSGIHSVSVAPCPPHQPRALMYEVEKVCVQSSSEFLIVGPRDSCRLIVSWLFINGELVSPSFTFTYARLAITLNDARAISWGEEKQTFWTYDYEGGQSGILLVAFLDDEFSLHGARREVDGIRRERVQRSTVCVPFRFVARRPGFGFVYSTHLG